MSINNPRTMSHIFRLDFTRHRSDVTVMDTIRASKIRYIKLGAGGAWEGALDRGRVEWGVATDPHEPAAAQDWVAVADAYAKVYAHKGVVTGTTNEARAFYDDDESVLWITFARGRMWWAFADAEVHWTGGDATSEGTRYRVAQSGWCDCDANGEALGLERLSTRLTQVSAYQRAVCTLSDDQREQCLRYINASLDPEQVAVADARAALKENLTLLVKRLSWGDFEQLVDLTFARSGWVRVSDLGKTGKDIDLVVEQPLSGARIAIQVKSSATQAVVDDYARRLDERPESDALMLVCHSPKGLLAAPITASGRSLDVMLPDRLVDLSINAGLIDWIVERAR